jgi:antitoxin HicB
MKTQVYTVIYEADLEGGFVVSVPALPGCYSQGDTLEDAEVNITEAITVYLESLKEEHKDLPQDHIWQGRVQVTV